MATRRIYYDDAYARDFTARVLSCEAVPPNLQAGITGKAWAVVLDRTALYPTSGGQPHDFGKLGDAAVLDVLDDGDDVVHIVDREVPEGPLTGCVDWPRRLDHMQQHTGQHLLSALFQERFGLPTVSFHLGAEICSIDLRGPEPEERTLEGIERAANKIIFEDRAIHVHYATPEQLAERGVRKQVQREGMLRVIEIAGADYQPCGGTHVRSTGQIGLVLVRRHSKVRQDWRVEFVCGGRAESVARADFGHLRRAARALECAPDEVPAAAERLVAERDAHFASLRAALERLANTEVTNTLDTLGHAVERVHVIERVFDGLPPEYLGIFAAALVKRAKVVALLATAESGDLVFAQHPDAGRDMAAVIKQLFAQIGGKGGGSKDFARGKLKDTGAAQRALKLAHELLS
jgi:alanyl-tRNA synthetase